MPCTITSSVVRQRSGGTSARRLRVISMDAQTSSAITIHVKKIVALMGTPQS